MVRIKPLRGDNVSASPSFVQDQWADHFSQSPHRIPAGLIDRLVITCRETYGLAEMMQVFVVLNSLVTW